MSGDVIFSVVWLSMATIVFTWGAVMIACCRELEIYPRRAFFLDGQEPFGTWMLLAFAALVFLPVGVGLLASDSVQLYREVSR